MASYRGMFLGLVHLFLFSACGEGKRHGRGYGECEKQPSMYHKAYPPQYMQIPIDHFHNETRYSPHLNGTFANRWWCDASHYKPGGPVIIENKGEWSYTDFPSLRVGLLHELARATNGVAVLFDHRYYGSNPVQPVDYLKDFRFLSVDQAMADQAYFAQNVVFPGLEQYDLTARSTPWFAIGGSYPGALTAWIRIQYPDVFAGAIASSAITALKEGYWEYMDVVRKYSPPKCAETFGKIIDVADGILLGDNQTEMMQLKSLWDYASVNMTNADFGYYYLYFWYGLQSKNWIPCLEGGDGLSWCIELTSPTLLYPKAEKLRDAVKTIVNKSRWANESDSLTTAWLNYLGGENGYQKVNTSESVHAFAAGRRLKPEEDLLAYLYQTCTELGLFTTGDNPLPDILPVISRTQTLHYVKRKMCQEEVYVNLSQASGPYKLNRYGGFNISYDRLMFTGGEVDPWRPASQLATRVDKPTRLNYSSTPEQPWYLIPGGSHMWDLYGVFPNQTSPEVPPEAVKRVHMLEKETIIRWAAEWHASYPGKSVYKR